MADRYAQALEEVRRAVAGLSLDAQEVLYSHLLVCGLRVGLPRGEEAIYLRGRMDAAESLRRGERVWHDYAGPAVQTRHEAATQALESAAAHLERVGRSRLADLGGPSADGMTRLALRVARERAGEWLAAAAAVRALPIEGVMW